MIIECVICKKDKNCSIKHDNGYICLACYVRIKYQKKPCPSCGNNRKCQYKFKDRLICVLCYEKNKNISCSKCKKQRITNIKNINGKYLCNNCRKKNRKKQICPLCNKKKILDRRKNELLVCSNCMFVALAEKCIACFEKKPVHVRNSNGCPICCSCSRKVKNGKTYDDIISDINFKKEWNRPENIKKRKIKKELERRANNLDLRILQNLRMRVWNAISKGYKSASTKDLIGCSTEDLRRHLESKFTEGMFWSNYGKGGWHIDHIIPCNSFNLLDPNEQKACFNYKNLQPLWEIDNLKKGSKLWAT